MYYKTTFTGDLQIDFLTENQLNVLEEYILKHSVLSEVARVDRLSAVIYFSGDIDNTGNIVEELLLKIAPYAPADFEAVIVSKGDDISDRRDLIIKENWLFVKVYELVSSECLRYSAQS